MQLVVDGLLTNYEIIGKKPNKLLILHGWMRSYDEWLTTAKLVSDRYEVILLNLPGFGKTALPDSNFTIYDYATFVEHFLKKIEINKVTLLGHSFGGRIGIIMAAKTDIVTTLILVDAAGVERRTPFARLKIKFFKIAKSVFPKTIVEKLRNNLGSPDYKTAGVMRPVFLHVINEDLSYLLPDISIPTLLLWGNKDSEVQEWKTLKMKMNIKKSQLKVIWESGHNPHLEKPNDFIEAINTFLLSTQHDK